MKLVIALVVTPDGFPLAYEVMPGNTSDNTTLSDFLTKIEDQYGRSDRVWIMDRGIPTEHTLEAMREVDAPVRYLVGTPKGRLTRLEKSFLELPWQEVRQSVKEIKHNLAIRPIFHQLEQRIEAHIFVSFIAYCVLVTLKNLARPQAPDLTPRAIVQKFAAIQMVDIHVPTADGRHLVLARHTQPSQDHELLLRQLDLTLPKQPAPKLLS